MKHRRAQIDDAIIETFKPLEKWNPTLTYKQGDRRLYYDAAYNPPDPRRLCEWEALVEIDPKTEPYADPKAGPDDRWLLINKDPMLFGFKTVQRQYTPWTSLKKQDAIPALMLVPGDQGSKPDAPATGFIDERYPVNVQVVLEEARAQQGKTPYFLIDQVSDAHYSIEKQWKGNHILSVAGVQRDGTQIEGWRCSEENLYAILIVQFRIIVVHRYRWTESV